MSGFEVIIYQKRDGIGYVTLNRPQALNAYNLQMRDELYQVLGAIRDDPEVEVVIFLYRQGDNTKTNRYIMLLLIISVTSCATFASSGWHLLGLEELNITSLNPDGGILFAGCDTGLHVYDGKDKWDKYPGLRRLPVHAVENLRTYQIAISGCGTWSDAAYFGKPEINGFPFYKFYHLDYIAWPYSLAIKTTQEKDTIFIGCLNNIFFTEFDTSTRTLDFVPMKTPKNCFGTNNPKCAALQIFNDNQLFAGGYDQDTNSLGQGNLLWEMGDSPKSFSGGACSRRGAFFRGQPGYCDW